MKQYLLETFQFNDAANRNMIGKIKHLPDAAECTRHLSHLINSQKKWLARILQDPAAPQMGWWEPVYAYEELEKAWNNSLQAWVQLINKSTEEQLFEEVQFTGYDGARWAARLVDIILQLNYHSIHHRAQMQLFIRAQGAQPEFIDYIGTKYRRLS